MDSMVKIAMVKHFLVWLVAAGVCVAAGRGMLSSLMATLNSYLSHPINENNREYSLPGLSTTNTKREVSVKPLKLLGKVSVRETPQQESHGDKVILFWTTWFGKAWRVRVGDGVNLRAAHCPEARCTFTHDRSKLKEATAVLFQVR